MATLILKADFVPMYPYDQDGLWETVSGKSVLLCHASKDGKVSQHYEQYVHDVDYVVSCYPLAVAEHYGVRTIGTWEGPTEAYVYELGFGMCELHISEASVTSAISSEA